jgi:hypothetical protein
MEPDDFSVRAQCTASEGPRSGSWHVSVYQWVGGLRAVEDQSACIPDERTSKLGVEGKRRGR